MTSSAAHRLASVLAKRNTSSDGTSSSSSSLSGPQDVVRVMATSSSNINTNTNTNNNTRPSSSTGSQRRHSHSHMIHIPALLRPSQMSDRVPLCADRKGPFDHLVPRPLLVSGSVTLSNFMSDQLEQEMDRELLVEQEKLTPEEADRENDEWEAIHRHEEPYIAEI
eukprot:scaffold3519_cov50-Attheya_sp.AAC.2